MEKFLEDYIKEGDELMLKALEHLTSELGNIRTGKASPAILSNLMVESYGAPAPLAHVANVSAVDSKTLSIQPWDKSMLKTIEQAIFASNLGITPMNDGEFIRLTIPALTEERRKDLAKQSHALGEEAKISMRSTRHKLLGFIKKEVEDGYPEDSGKKKEEEVEKMIKAYYKKVETLLEAKEKDIMTV
jgi:ribosome recycling factor